MHGSSLDSSLSFLLLLLFTIFYWLLTPAVVSHKIQVSTKYDLMYINEVINA
jgi:hypothetical protein